VIQLQSTTYCGLLAGGSPKNWMVQNWIWVLKLKFEWLRTTRTKSLGPFLPFLWSHPRNYPVFVVCSSLRVQKLTIWHWVSKFEGSRSELLGLGYGMCSLGAVQHDPTFPLCAWFGVAGVWGVARGWGLPEEKLRTQPRKPVVWGSRKDFVVDFSSKFSGLGSVALITMSEVDSRLRIQRRPNLSKCS